MFIPPYNPTPKLPSQKTVCSFTCSKNIPKCYLYAFFPKKILVIASLWWHFGHTHTHFIDLWFMGTLWLLYCKKGIYHPL